MSTCLAVEHKACMYKKTQEYFTKYENFMFISIKKVKATQLKDVKTEIGLKAKFLIAKNKIMKKALEDLDADKYANIIARLHNNIIVVFFDGVDPKSILNASKNHMRKANAVPGDIAPTDVVIPAGPTGLGPEKINIFQAAKIITKINKGKIDLANDHKLLSVGDVVSISNSKLLAMLNVQPFEYGLDIIKIFEDGDMYEKDLLYITEESIIEAFNQSVSLVAAVSLGTQTVTEASIPFEIRNAFADLVKVSLATGFEIQQFKN